MMRSLDIPLMEAILMKKSERYVERIQINKNTILKARIFKEGYNPGLVETQLYLIDVTHDLPIVSISTNPQNLWDDYTGIYVAGKNGESGNCRSDSLNWNRDWAWTLTIRPWKQQYI